VKDAESELRSAVRRVCRLRGVCGGVFQWFTPRAFGPIAAEPASESLHS
jgi:hypothetical protein